MGKPEFKEVSISISLRAMRVEGFEITDAANLLSEPIKFDDYEYSFAPTIHVSETKKLVEIKLQITIQDKNSKELFGVFKTSMLYQIENFEEIIPSGPKGISIPDFLIQMLSGICISTSRGLLASYTANTNLSNAIIPVVDPSLFKPIPEEELPST
jgi:hypothetical protein